jgi:competence protein ComEC
MWWTDLSTEPDGRRREPRAPALPVALAAAVGVGLDRWCNGTLDPTPSPAWTVAGWSLGLLVGLLALLIGRHRDVQTAALLLMVACVWGAWHQLCWIHRAPDALEYWAHDEGQPVQLRGRVVTASQSQVRDDGQPVAVVLFSVTQLKQSESWVAASGRARLTIERTDARFAAGTELEVLGQLQRPPAAGNPGTFDFRLWLRRRGIDVLMKVDSLDAVTVRSASPNLLERLSNLRQSARVFFVSRFRQTLSADAATIAEAMLVGTRSQLPDDMRLAFQQTGTLHILAISGVNVGVLWWLLTVLFRVMGFGWRATGVLVIVSLMLYAWLTDLSPPVVRATLVACLWQAGLLTGRTIGSTQALSLSVIAMLAWNPSDLFDVGAQLSFLSVAVLAKTLFLTRNWFRPSSNSSTLPTSWLSRAVWRGVAVVGPTIAVTVAVWIVTTPYVAARFHLISPAGLVLNAVLGPLFLGLLWLGYIWMLWSCLGLPGGSWLLMLWDGIFSPVVTLLKTCSQLEVGHVFVPDMPVWWLLGFYGVLLLLAVTVTARQRIRACQLLLGWTALGLTAGLLPNRPGALTVDVLHVGHGLAVVMHTPGQRVVVYDCGSLIGPEIAAEAVTSTIWSHGCHRLDLLILSHADADHCNGVSAVSDRLQPGRMLVSRAGLARQQSEWQAALTAWTQAGGDVVYVDRGSRVIIEQGLTIECLHPRLDFRADRDNAHSLVIRIEYAGRSMLLTGDLEREGLAELLQQRRRPADVVLSPHHGSKAANPAEFAAWSGPEWLAVSGSDRRVLETLSKAYAAETQIELTAVTGRQRYVIDREGHVRAERFRHHDHASVSSSRDE